MPWGLLPLARGHSSSAPALLTCASGGARERTPCTVACSISCCYALLPWYIRVQDIERNRRKQENPDLMDEDDTDPGEGWLSAYQRWWEGSLTR